MKKLTKGYVDGLRPSNKEDFYWDCELTGFGVKVFPSGTKSFVVQYRTPERRTRRYTIGKLGDALTPDQARRVAKDLLASVVKGADPQGDVEKRREAWTVNDLMDAYLASETFAGKAKSTRGADYGRINRHVRPLIGTRFADRVTTEELRRMHRAIVEGKTGLFYNEHTADGLIDAIRRFEEWEPDFRPEDAVANAARFSPQVFETGFRAALDYFRQREIDSWVR